MRSAEADLARLEAFIATESRAERAVARILRGVSHLSQFPELGVALDKGFRQLFLKYGKSGYVVRYCVKGEEVIITRIWHGKEDRR